MKGLWLLLPSLCFSLLATCKSENPSKAENHFAKDSPKDIVPPQKQALQKRLPPEKENLKNGSLPSACSTNCTTAYGSTLGTSHGVDGFSNCSTACVHPEPYHSTSPKVELKEKTYTGIRWQCVEYARRWWLINKGFVFGSVDTADDMWTQLKFATRPGVKGLMPITAIDNGSLNAPVVGDLLIYKSDKDNYDMRFGHVAVIVEVLPKSKQIRVAEQNFNNKNWEDAQSHSRTLTLKIADKHFLITDKTLAIYGWLHIAAP